MEKREDTEAQNGSVDENKESTKFSWKELFQHFGPGLLVSIAYMDPGNLAGDITAGQTGRYSLLWILLLATALGYFFQNRAMMLGLVTGKDMAMLCRQQYPKWMSLILWIMAEIAIIGSDIQEVMGSAIALEILFGLKLWVGVLLTIFSTILILIIKYVGMRALELVFAILIGTMAVCFFIQLGFIGPNFSQILTGVFVPSVPASAFSSMVGLIGAVLMPHNLFLHSSLVYEKNISRTDLPLLKKSIFYFKVETGVSLFVSFLVSLAVICTFAHFSDSPSQISLQEAGKVLQETFGMTAKYIWGVGLFAAGQSSTLTGTLTGQYVMSGFINLRVGKVKRAFITRSIAIVPSIIIAFTSADDDFNNTLNILQAIQLPFAVIPLLKFSFSELIMGKEFTMDKIQLIFLSVSSSAIVGVNYYTSIPENIDWHSVWIYVIIAFMISYFFLLSVLLVRKIGTQKEQICETDEEDKLTSVKQSVV